jgi:hypothetical protein
VNRGGVVSEPPLSLLFSGTLKIFLLFSHKLLKFTHMNSTTFIVYKSNAIGDDPEVLITTPELENTFLYVWFSNTGRDKETYSRNVYSDTGIRVRVSGLRVM